MPKDFFFGAATSAHQVEGKNHNDWTEWEKKNGPRIAASGRAADHYNRFRGDFDIAKELGHNAHRFSIEWSRIEPEEGKWNEKEIEHYREVVKALRERGLEPFITLWHWTMPVWLAEKGGVLAPQFSEYFTRFAEKVVGELKDNVHFWITLNEPEVFTNNSYRVGLWPPQKKSWRLTYRAIHSLIRAHRAASEAIKKIAPSVEVGVVTDIIHFDSAGGPWNNFIRWGAERLWNFYFINHLHGTLDFIGINYYFHSHIKRWFNKNKNEMVTDIGWEIYPEGIYHILKSFSHYGLPIYITENGLADAEDKYRSAFIEEHLKWIRKAMDEGVDVRGYLHWSLIDNFEWDKGFVPQFGLVAVNYETMERTVRKSALHYKKLIEHWKHGK